MADFIGLFSPGGDLIEFYEAPQSYCTNICFGGPDRRAAYITLPGRPAAFRVTPMFTTPSRKYP